MVAFNMQGYGSSLWLMHGMFRLNGGCGYVNKAEILMKKDTGAENDIFNPKVPLPVKKTLKFQALQGMVQTNPQILQPMLQELGKQNPQLLGLIQDHHAQFLQLLNERMDGSKGSFLFNKKEIGNKFPCIMACLTSGMTHFPGCWRNRQGQCKPALQKKDADKKGLSLIGEDSGGVGQRLVGRRREELVRVCEELDEGWRREESQVNLRGVGGVRTRRRENGKSRRGETDDSQAADDEDRRGRLLGEELVLGQCELLGLGGVGVTCGCGVIGGILKMKKCMGVLQFSVFV